ncbi:hypothetical protein AQ809_03220 [Burkholderia pseudomallei]|nr:hypothetical protein BFR05_24625 [Burkholderia pseudomallei]EQA87082.1 hypothetical protein M218_21295 [Burkholderia pseudomallei MSHR338]KEO67244.1 hypothetical protein J103_23765 [Burkholderia pseudomallei MSHR5855]APG01056.1 hypothetical protein BFR06_24645 [Burkholderia pseudomallei]APY95013.1 hypothetical protein BGI50_18595 [Burkholderia pseudomallei]
MAAIRVVHRDRHVSRIDADPVIASRVIFMAVFRRVDATECALAARIRSRGERRRGRGAGGGAVAKARASRARRRPDSGGGRCDRAGWRYRYLYFAIGRC